MPFYTPYGDYKFAKLMYETSYDLKKKFKIQRHLISKFDKKLASLYCTRGFPLGLVDISNFFKYSRMINNDVSRNIFISRELKNFYYKKLINYSFSNSRFLILFLIKKKYKKKLTTKIWEFA